MHADLRRRVLSSIDSYNYLPGQGQCEAKKYYGSFSSRAIVVMPNRYAESIPYYFNESDFASRTSVLPSFKIKNKK
jgi:hypothetical protein